ncbi:MAG: DUF4416 family protein [Kiritimatiellae bacterium]|nr:DUF4416 family protein [Kiritimatiellia bacterium]MDD5522510.1 DUF4416 family protein [Kiritimatiellia bacterium]
MGSVKPVKPVKFFCGIIGINKEVILRAVNELGALLGKIDQESEFMPFNFTDYYADEMGNDLFRQFVSFQELMDPRKLAEIKLVTNTIEDKFTVTSNGKVHRTVNLDPGYITASNLILATTKEFSHRICIGEGIYAEVTLNFKKNGCVFFPWTYPDFKSGKYTSFFLEIRRRYMEITRTSSNSTDHQS